MTPLCGVPPVTKRTQVRSGLVLAPGRGQTEPSSAHSSRWPRTGRGVCRANSRRSAVTSSAPSASASGALAQVRRKHGARLWRTRLVGPSPLSTASSNSNNASRRSLSPV